VIELVSYRGVQAGNHLKRKSSKIEILSSSYYQKFFVGHVIGASNVRGCLVTDDDGTMMALPGPSRL
jgi:hypothetical protein